MRIKETIRRVFILVCVIIGLQVCKEQAYSESDSAVNPFNLVVASSEGLVKLRYNLLIQAYEKQAERAVSGIINIIKCDGYYFVNAGGELLRLDEGLNKTISKKFEKISALTSDSKNIYISAEKCLIVLDKDLKELSRVKLEFNGYSKDAHGILIYSNIAYLLDNVMLPLFILRVDTKDPGHIRLMEKIRIEEAIWPHLVGQWLNPSLNQWIVLQSYSGEIGGGVKAHIYPIDKGAEELASQKINSVSIYPENKKEGYLIKGIISLPPIWAVVQDFEGKNYLAQVNSDNNEISFTTRLDLDELNTASNNALETSPSGPGASDKIVIKQRGTYLFLAFSFSGSETTYDPAHDWRSTSGFRSGKLVIIDTKQQPKIIISEVLRKFNIAEIVDILPY